jgi:hypothetical protein
MPNNREMPSEPYSGSVPVVVIDGKTLQLGHKLYRGGEIVKLTPKDVEKQVARGVVKKAAK